MKVLQRTHYHAWELSIFGAELIIMAGAQTLWDIASVINYSRHSLLFLVAI
jgi:hypothetical protein